MAQDKNQTSADNARQTQNQSPFGKVIEPLKTAAEDKGSRSLRFWLAIGLVAAVMLLVAALLFFFFGGRGKIQPTPAATPLEVTQPVSKEIPPPPPPVANQDEATLIREYFTKVSPAFKEEFMARIPQVAVDSYKKYVNAESGGKLEAARAVYIYLNHPGISLGDKQYAEFLGDVRKDLEKAIGQPLF